jgi:hypothetical protein
MVYILAVSNNNSSSESDSQQQETNFEAEDEEEEGNDPGDSDVSEERNAEDLINGHLSPVSLDNAEQKRPDDVVSVINNAFNNR